MIHKQGNSQKATISRNSRNTTNMMHKQGNSRNAAISESRVRCLNFSSVGFFFPLIFHVYMIFVCIYI